MPAKAELNLLLRIYLCLARWHMAVRGFKPLSGIGTLQLFILC